MVFPNQCKDIPDLPILEFIASHNGEWCFNHYVCRPEHQHERSVGRAMPPGTVSKLALAKMRVLHRRGLVDGCPCGCRGDWVITPKGREFIDQTVAIEGVNAARRRRRTAQRKAREGATYPYGLMHCRDCSRAVHILLWIMRNGRCARCVIENPFGDQKVVGVKI